MVPKIMETGELNIHQEISQKERRPAEIKVRYCRFCQQVTRIIHGHCDECGCLVKDY